MTTQATTGETSAGDAARSRWDIESAAQELLAREQTGTTRSALTDEWSELTLPAAYHVQDEALRRRLARGEQTVGVKLALTSRAKQQRMGVDRPGVAWLTDAMILPAGLRLPQERLIHPRAEPEIAFVMRERLAGPGVTSASALAAVDRAYAGVEIIDSRYRDFRFTLPDTIADNASSALFITGPVGVPVETLDLSHEACLVEVDGHVVDTATGAAVSGHPAEALALAANTLAERGHPIEAGWIVLTGGMTDAVELPPGRRLAVEFSNLGAITLLS